jgi:hypothetical protein
LKLPEQKQHRKFLKADGIIYADSEESKRNDCYGCERRKEKGLAYVFDIAPSGKQPGYMDGGEDITPTVKSKLGATGTASKPASK